MEDKTVLYEKHERIAKVILNRPRYKNAQSRRLLEEMDAAFAEANADDDVRVIILAGAGDNFWSGHDLGTPEEKEDQAAPPVSQGRPRRVRALAPNVPRQHAAMARSRQAHHRAGAGLVHFRRLDVRGRDGSGRRVRRREVPAPLLQYFSIPWDMPPRKAKEILFQSRFVDAQEADRLGFVNLVVPRAELEDGNDGARKSNRGERSLHAPDG